MEPRNSRFRSRRNPSSLLKNGDWLPDQRNDVEKHRPSSFPVPLFQQAAISWLPWPVVLAVLTLAPVEAQAQLPAGASPQRMLYSVETEETAFNWRKWTIHRKRLTTEQKHYLIQFEQHERFKFIIPHQYAWPGVDNPFTSEGFTSHYYDEGRRFLPIANRILKIRQALLGAQQYFDKVAAGAGMGLEFPTRDPINIVFGTPTAENAVGQASFRDNWICFRPESLPKRSVAVHEYFHFVQEAVLYRNFWQFRSVRQRREEPYESFLNDMTADWAMDEPIELEAMPGAPALNLDLTQHYLETGSAFMTAGDRAFFGGESETDRRYEANLLVKYWTEQMAGQQDKSGAAQLLKMYRRLYDLGGANKEGFFLALTEPLPGQFDAVGEELRWQKFFRHFCASNVVQSAALRSDANDPIGYHDEAFQSKHYLNRRAKTWRGESRRPAERIWPIPAANDEVRHERMRTLLDENDDVAPLAHVLHVIDLENSKAPARPVFIYAEGGAGADLYLLRQKQPSRLASDRTRGKFDLLSEFTFSPLHETDRPARKLHVVPGIDLRQQGDYLWVGLVNGATNQEWRQMAWTYLVSPRLIPNPAPALRPEPSETVRLVRGGNRSAGWRDEPVFFAGEEFELWIQTSGPLHHKNADVESLTQGDTALTLQILTDDNTELPLEESNGPALRIRAAQISESDRPDAWNYYISGRIAERVEDDGPARFRLRISSPLNLGSPDEEIDETLRFRLLPLQPYLEQFEIKKGDRVVYNSGEGIRLPPRQENGAFKLEVTAEFSRPMNPAKSTITAGPTDSPDRWPIVDARWPNGEVCQGTFVIPASEVPSRGMVLRFAVSGEDQPNMGHVGRIDGDPLEPGAQPDTAHFIVIGLDEYWRVARTGSNRQSMVDVSWKIRLDGTWGSIRESTLLVNRGYDEYANYYVSYAIGQLGVLDREIERARKSVAALETDYKAAVAAKETDEVIAFRREALRRQRKRLGLMTLRVRPLVEALVRVEGGYRELGWHRDLSGPLNVAFHGMKVEWGPSGETDNPHSGRLLAEPTFIADAGSRRRDPDDEFYESDAIAWNIWPSDVKKVQQLINLTLNLPDYVTESEPPTPQPADSDDQRRLVQSVLHEYLDHDLVVSLYNLSRRMWAHYPTYQWPCSPSVLSGTGEGQFWRESRLLWRRLPSVETGRLLRLQYSRLIPPYYLPMRYEGLRYWTTPGISDPPSGETTESKDDREITTTWWPVGEHKQHREVHRISTETVWRYENRGPIISPFFDYPHPFQVRIGTHKEERARIRWSVLERNCSANVSNDNPNLVYLLMQPESDLAEATLRGMLRTWNYYDTPGNYVNHEWDTSWTIERIGDPLKPDPNTPLPEWNEALGDPPTLAMLEADASDSGAEPPGAENRESGPESESDSKDGQPGRSPSKGDVPRRAKVDWKSYVASSFDPHSELTTEVRANPDGSRTITTRDTKGNLRSTETVSAADRRQVSGSMIDAVTGESRTVASNPDGSRTITVRDSEGIIVSQDIVSSADRRRPSASIRDPQTGHTITSEQLPDGSVVISTRDANGKLIGDPVTRKK